MAEQFDLRIVVVDVDVDVDVLFVVLVDELVVVLVVVVVAVVAVVVVHPSQEPSPNMPKREETGHLRKPYEVLELKQNGVQESWSEKENAAWSSHFYWERLVKVYSPGQDQNSHLDFD